MIREVDIRTRLRALRDGIPAEALPERVAFVAEIVDDDDVAEFLGFGDEHELAAYLSTLQGGDPFGRGPLTITWRGDYDRGESSEELVETVRALVTDMLPLTLQ